MSKINLIFSKENVNKWESIFTFIIYYILPIISLLTIIGGVYNPTLLSSKGRRAEQGTNILLLLLFIKPIRVLIRRYTNPNMTTLPEIIYNIKSNIEYQTTNRWKNIKKIVVDTLFSICAYLMRFRRQLGIATFWFIFTHVLLIQVGRRKAGISLWTSFGNQAMIAGSIGIIALFIGGITSNNRSIRLFTKYRKKIQMIAYLAFIMAMIHLIILGKMEYLGRLIAYCTLKIRERRK